jgi:hypothetical protein
MTVTGLASLAGSVFSSGMISSGLIGGPIIAGGGSIGGMIVTRPPVDPVVITKVNFDTIFGGEGEDVIHGGPGDDSMHGDEGDDRLFPDAGVDEVFGNAGRDTLVSLGGGADKLSGGRDGDTFWKDPADTTDADFGEILFGGVQEVTSFSGGVSTELDGQRLPDPGSLDINDHFTSRDDYQPAWRNFADRPLFGSGGVRFDDVRQGGVGDTNLLTALAALAGKHPHRLKQAVVDLGDGTFAVKLLGGNGAHRYYRVDADLPVTSDGTPYYAGLGHGGALWAAVVEKAFAMRHGRAYATLDRVELAEAFAAFGLRPGEDVYLEMTTRTDIWNNSIQTMFDVKEALDAGQIVTARTTNAAIRGNVPVQSGRLYVVEAVNMGALKPVSMTLREVGGSSIVINYAQIELNVVGVDAWA